MLLLTVYNNYLTVLNNAYAGDSSDLNELCLSHSHSFEYLVFGITGEVMESWCCVVLMNELCTWGKDLRVYNPASLSVFLIS